MASRPRNDVVAREAGEWVELGRIGAAFGVRGWVKVISHTRPREGIFEYSRWYLDNGSERRPHDLDAGKAQGSGLIARLAGIADRNAAETLNGWSVWVPREELASNDPDEYYWRDLVGLTVINTAGEHLGQVRELMETGANDVLVVEGDRERLLPFVGAVVREVDLETGRMVVDWDGDF